MTIRDQLELHAMKIYICGGSSELAMIGDYMRRLREMGHTITHDWVAIVRANGEANPRSATHRQRDRWSSDDLRGIEDAAMVWVLLPPKPSFGCAFEMGYAIGHGGAVVVSGDWRASIFSAQALARFNEHDHALEWLRLYCAAGNHDDEMLELEEP